MREDWIEVELGKICNYSKGKRPIVLAKEYSEETPYPYINIKAFEHGIFDEYTDGSKCNLCEDGDLLMVWDGARAGFTGKAKKGAIGSTLMKVEPKKGVEKNYLFYFLLSLYKKLNTNPRGVGIPHVEPSLLWTSELIIPSLPEQRAIVQKIENYFELLDKGIAELKTAQEQLKVYRQAVLKKAFEGGFTATAYNRKDKARPVSKEENNLPEGWKWVKLKDVATKIGSGSTPQGGQANYKTKGIPLIRSMNIHSDFIKYDGLAYIDEQQAKSLDNVTVFEDDILLNITGASIGRVNIAPKQWKNARVNQHVSIIRLNKEFYNSKFIKYFIQAPNIQEWITNENYGATRQALSKSMIENILIPNISLSEQHAIVREIESRLSVCDKLEQSISESLEKAEALRQSILKKAFDGRLLSGAEVTACKQEADYEPASVLLEKIKKEKK